MKHFSREEIFALDPSHVADALSVALGVVSGGAALAPIRSHIDLGGGAGTFLISGVLTELDLLSVKVISVRPSNPARGLERLQGALTVFESSSGVPRRLTPALRPRCEPPHAARSLFASWPGETPPC